ncbi:hypothetical protein EV05_0104 [Prochlorococcus sp. MIT 0601]|nr:hypothetical protein EV05_0104 [Prochlorococcus sp. MIT 0601]
MKRRCYDFCFQGFASINLEPQKRKQSANGFCKFLVIAFPHSNALVH